MGMCLSSFVLLACVSLAAHTASPGRRFLPNDIAAWNRAPHFRNVTRWWSIEDLSPANQHMGSSVRARKLLDKLDSGQRIVVAAFGSSFVHDYAGGPLEKDHLLFLLHLRLLPLIIQASLYILALCMLTLAA